MLLNRRPPSTNILESKERRKRNVPLFVEERIRGWGLIVNTVVPLADVVKPFILGAPGRGG